MVVRLALPDHEVDRIFRALADATRRDILRRTLAGEASVSQLAAAYDMSFAAVQKHVAVLEAAGFVTKEPQGRERIIRGNPDTIRQAQLLLGRYEEIWRSRIDRLDAMLAADGTGDAGMPITSVIRDTEDLTLTVVADFSAPVQRLWEAYVDPRQLERFWGPPTYPATFTRHDAALGGRSAYTITGPEGDSHGGYWEWLSVDPQKGFEVRDGFATPEGEPNNELPSMRMRFVFEETDDGSRVTTTSHFDSLAALEKMLEMGVEEGLREAMGQMDAVLADLTSFAAGDATTTQILSDTQVRISRV